MRRRGKGAERADFVAQVESDGVRRIADEGGNVENGRRGLRDGPVTDSPAVEVPSVSVPEAAVTLPSASVVALMILTAFAVAFVVLSSPWRLTAPASPFMRSFPRFASPFACCLGYALSFERPARARKRLIDRERA
jgi:hypothetical protein